MSSQAADKSERLSIKGLYPLGDAVPNIRGVAFWRLRGQWTGEKRPPKKGEFYLSGSAITTYRAHEDLTETFHIARLVEVETVTTERIIRTL